MSSTTQSQHGFRTVFRVVSGNFLEMYDFMVYGFTPPPSLIPSFRPATSLPR
jgi:hypothetical protein